MPGDRPIAESPACYASWPERLDAFRHADDASLLICLDSITTDATRRSPPDAEVASAAQAARDCLADDGTRDLDELDAIFRAEAEHDGFMVWQARGAGLGRREAQRRDCVDQLVWLATARLR